MQKVVSGELDTLLNVLPPYIPGLLYQQSDCSDLLEIILDLGRPPEARFLHRDLILDSKEIERVDIDYVVSRVGELQETIVLESNALFTAFQPCGIGMAR